jgi:hypothetical protein
MDIMLTTYGICTLINVIIVDLICANLVLQVVFSQGVVMMIAT